jgi:hypothetical protein
MARCRSGEIYRPVNGCPAHRVDRRTTRPAISHWNAPTSPPGRQPEGQSARRPSAGFPAQHRASTQRRRTSASPRTSTHAQVTPKTTRHAQAPTTTASSACTEVRRPTQRSLGHHLRTNAACPRWPTARRCARAESGPGQSATRQRTSCRTSERPEPPLRRSQVRSKFRRRISTRTAVSRRSSRRCPRPQRSGIRLQGRCRRSGSSSLRHARPRGLRGPRLRR